MIERVIPIVEGEGEVIAVPKLLYKLMRKFDLHAHIETPHRIKRNGILKPQVLETAVERAAIAGGPRSAILILLDSDHLTPGEDPPCVLGPKLLALAKDARSDRRILVCLAEVEFETWFIAAAESLCGRERLPSTLSRPDNFEGIRGAKEWLSSQIDGPYKYKPTASQAALVQHMDLDLARHHSASFRRFCTRFRELLG